MIDHPPIVGKRLLVGDHQIIYDEILSLIPRLGLLGETRAANLMVQAVEILVDAAPSGDIDDRELQRMIGAIDAYNRRVEAARLATLIRPG